MKRRKAENYDVLKRRVPIMKKRQYYIAILTICGIVLLSGCSKKNTKSNNSYNNYTNQTTSSIPTQPTTTVPENAPKVSLSNLTVMAGSEIDYMSAIEAVENMDLSKSMVYINSSNVDRFTPGSYTVYYNFDYMGYTVKSFITVTVLENTTQETVSSSETTTESASAENNSPSEQNSSPAEAPSTEVPPEQSSDSASPSSEQTGETTTSSTDSNVLDATVYNKDLPIPDAVFTLSTGETVTIKNTPERYIVETFTDDIYYTEDGYNFLCSELKILLNTGEVQTIETVISRVNSIPE